MPSTVSAVFGALSVLCFTSVSSAPAPNLEAPPPPRQLTEPLYHAKQMRNQLNEYVGSVNEIVDYLDEWAINEISNITNSHDLNTTVFKDFSDKISYLSQNFTDLSLEFQRNDLTNNSVEILKIKSSNLNVELGKMNVKLDNDTRDSLRMYCDYLNRTDLVGRFLTLFNDSINMNEVIEEAEQAVLTKDCVEAIKRKDFKIAAENLNKISDDQRIEFMVDQLLQEKINNFYLVLNFSKHILKYNEADLKKNFVVFKKLVLETRSRETNEIRLIKMIDHLESMFADSECCLNEVEPLLKLLKSDLKKYSIMKFTDIIENSSESHSGLLLRLYTLDRDLAFDVCYLTYLDNRNDRTVTTLMAMFKHALEHNIAHEKLFSFYNFIRTFFNKISAPEYFTELVQEVNLSTDLEAAKAALFANKVCLVTKDGFLRSSETSEAGSFIVYPYVSNTYVIYEKWVLKHLQFDTYRIESTAFDNYCLAPSKSNGLNKTAVLLSECNPLYNLEWELEFNQPIKKFQIKHTGSKKYLMFDGKLVRVTISEKAEDTDQFFFNIQDCS